MQIFIVLLQPNDMKPLARSCADPMWRTPVLSAHRESHDAARQDAHALRR
jgi:hypothetical protein